MNRFPKRVLVPFGLFVAAIAGGQYWVFRLSQPSPDAIEYFEVADQIRRAGYADALSLHWSPLYPLYLLAARALTGAPLARELSLTSAADAVLLSALCAIVAAVFVSLGRRCFPDRPDAARAWLATACGLVIYCAFSVLRVGLRMPDALVTCMTVLVVWAWCRAMMRGASLRWSALAGLLSGLAFLTRANLLHWSVVVAACACVLAPHVRAARRWTAYGVFLLSLLAVVGPQTYVLSTARGHFTFGESGKLVFAETYGAIWPNKYPAWPVRVGNGDVRIFTETRDLNFPGFYEPGREYDDATVPFRLTKTVLTFVRSVHASLFGYWSPSFALMWPLWWVLWPALLFGVGLRSMIGGERGLRQEVVVRRRVAWFLMGAGAVGVGMHLASFSIGYYLPPYLIPLVMGLYLIVLDHAEGEPAALRQRYRAAWIVAAGLVITTGLTSASYFRRNLLHATEDATADTAAIADALSSLPPHDGGRRHIAAAGLWLGVYAVRLSNSQIVADVPNPAALHDPVRSRAIVDALRAEGVVAILIPRTDVEPDDPLPWRPVTSTWALAELR